MKTAVYDNPATMQREAWRDGEVIASVTAKWLCEAQDGKFLPFMLNIGPWRKGQVFGNPLAIAVENRP